MWVMGYWMERGFKPEEILSLTSNELTIYQAVAELNREQRKQDIREAIIEAVEDILKNISGG